MNLEVQLNGAVAKLALNRIEAAKAINVSPATLDRLTARGLLRPCRATRRPVYWVKELERFLRENSAADYVLSVRATNGLPGHRANRVAVMHHLKSNFPGVSPPALGESINLAGNENKKGASL
jgi:hypothetical protein